MAKLPHPPTVAELQTEGLQAHDVVAVAPHSILWRVHRTVGSHVQPWNALRRYGPLPFARFEPHDPPPHDQERGVLYLGLDIKTCLAEAFQVTRRIDRIAGAPYLTGMRMQRTLNLLDLEHDWPTRAGASQALNTGRRDVSSAWARTIREAFHHVDGLWYPSSMHGGGVCIALFDTGADALPGQPVVSEPLAHPALSADLSRYATELGYRFP